MMNIIFAQTEYTIRPKLMKIIPLKRYISLLLILIGFSASASASNPPAAYRIKTIVIDAGHGGKDGHTHGSFSKEKDVALQVALRLGKSIEEKMKDVKVIYTRTTDVFIPLYERVGIANRAKADLFISIHCNDMPVVNSRYISGYTKNKKGKK